MCKRSTDKQGVGGGCPQIDTWGGGGGMEEIPAGVYVQNIYGRLGRENYLQVCIGNRPRREGEMSIGYIVGMSASLYMERDKVGW